MQHLDTFLFIFRNLAITDANLVLGRILPEYFPKIFGPRCNEGLDWSVIPLSRDWLFKRGFFSAGAYVAMEKLTAQINEYVRKNPNAIDKEYTVEEVQLLQFTIIMVARAIISLFLGSLRLRKCGERGNVSSHKSYYAGLFLLFSKYSECYVGRDGYTVSFHGGMGLEIYLIPLI